MASDSDRAFIGVHVAAEDSVELPERQLVEIQRFQGVPARNPPSGFFGAVVAAADPRRCPALLGGRLAPGAKRVLGFRIRGVPRGEADVHEGSLTQAPPITSTRDGVRRIEIPRNTCVLAFAISAYKSIRSVLVSALENVRGISSRVFGRFAVEGAVYIELVGIGVSRPGRR